MTLLFCIQRAILYPGQKILVVCPVKNQSRNFIKKIYDFIGKSPNLAREIDVANIKTGLNESEIPFFNGSTIFTTVYGENALGKLNAQNYSNIICNIGEEIWKAEMLIRVEVYI